jgi:hypothetical protein
MERYDSRVVGQIAGFLQAECDHADDVYMLRATTEVFARDDVCDLMQELETEEIRTTAVDSLLAFCMLLDEELQDDREPDALARCVGAVRKYRGTDVLQHAADLFWSAGQGIDYIEAKIAFIDRYQDRPILRFAAEDCDGDMLTEEKIGLLELDVTLEQTAHEEARNLIKDSVNKVEYAPYEKEVKTARRSIHAGYELGLLTGEQAEQMYDTVIGALRDRASDKARWIYSPAPGREEIYMKRMQEYKTMQATIEEKDVLLGR